MIRAAALALALAALAPAAWVESVEFPWSSFPRPLWERELVWLKNIGITHVSLPPAPGTVKDADAQLNELIRIVRRLNLEADLEGPVPEALEAQTRAHGGPLTEPMSAKPTRISALAPDAPLQSRKMLLSGNPSFIWTDVEDTLGPGGYHAGAVTFNGVETAGTTPLRRSAQLSRYWGQSLASLHELPGAGTRLPAPGISAEQFVSDNGASFVSVVNATAKPWTGDIKAVYPVLKRLLALPNVTVPAHDSVWLPVAVPLTAGPLCKDCTGFATVDHLIYSTAELTAMEYENSLLALEFAAPSDGEVVLQLSQQPHGPLVAGGKPSSFDWDENDKRVRLPIPAGKGATAHVRIALAIDTPDETAFFDNAHVLLIGETNSLTAQFSSEKIAQRSRLRTVPEFHIGQDPGTDPLHLVYRITVPDTAVHGDQADLALEADGLQMSHVRPELMVPVTVRFADSLAVRVGANSTLTLSPAVVPVNQRTGRDIGISIRNNAPEIRNFSIEMKAEGLDFSPPRIDVAVGASASRAVSFRVFASGAAAGIHVGEARVSGAAKGAEAVRFVVIPPNGAVAFESDGISMLESASRRASFLPGRWLEFVNKESGGNPIPAGGIPFQPGTIAARGDALVVGGQKVLRVSDLELMAPKVVPAPPPVPPKPKSAPLARRIGLGQTQENQCLGPAGFWICGPALSESQLTADERAVLLNPEDLCARGEIISRGFNTNPARIDHLLWMIRNHPEWDGFTANPLYSLESPPGLPLEPGSYDLAKRAWLQHVVSTHSSGIVLHNASMFFALQEPALAVELLKRAIKGEAGERVYVERLGMLFAICLMPENLERRVTDTRAFRGVSEEAKNALLGTHNWILLAGALTAFHGGATTAAPDIYSRLEEVRPGEEPWSIVDQLPSRGWRRSLCIPAPPEPK